MKGIDSSIVVYALDPSTDEHQKASKAVLSLEAWATTPTVVHEVYHTLAFKRMMSWADARSKVRAFARDKRTRFLNITKATSSFSLDLASEFEFGGRDSLIIGSFMRNGVETMLTHDGDLLRRRKVNFKGKSIGFSDPLA
jgi:predicted nucleic acid-binding protein